MSFSRGAMILHFVAKKSQIKQNIMFKMGCFPKLVLHKRRSCLDGVALITSEV